MRLRKLNIKSTLFSLLGYIDTSSEALQPGRVEELRLAMLAALGEAGCDGFTKVARQVRYAADVQALWYARSDLMAALASMHGEEHARQELESLTSLFRGLLPSGMMAGAFAGPKHGPSDR